MKRLIIAAIFVFFLSPVGFASNVQLMPGKTKLFVNTNSGEPVEISIDIAKPMIQQDEGWRWGAEQLKPKFSISNIDVRIGKEKLFVPLSAYIDLASPNIATLEQLEKGFMLSITGGDAGTSYKAMLIFQDGVIQSRKVSSGEFPDEAWEETKYSFNNLNN